MKVQFLIDVDFPTYNYYQNVNRTNRYAAAALKKDIQKKIKRIIGNCDVVLQGDLIYRAVWHEPNKKRDVDNVIFNKKFIFDAFQEAGIIPNDHQVRHLNETIVYGDSRYVEVSFEEITDSTLDELEGQMSLEDFDL